MKEVRDIKGVFVTNIDIYGDPATLQYTDPKLLTRVTSIELQKKDSELIEPRDKGGIGEIRC